MNIESILSEKHSKEMANILVDYIDGDSEKFERLMQFFFSSEYRTQQRAAFYVSHCYNAYPKLITPYLAKIIQCLENPKLSNALKRNSLRILQFVKIPEQDMGKLTELGFTFLLNPKEPIAVRVFSMSVLEKISNTHSAIKTELKESIEQILTFEQVSAGTLNRAKKILNRICDSN